jgi:hypothetical protein
MSENDVPILASLEHIRSIKVMEEIRQSTAARIARRKTSLPKITFHTVEQSNDELAELSESIKIKESDALSPSLCWLADKDTANHTVLNTWREG